MKTDFKFSLTHDFVCLRVKLVLHLLRVDSQIVFQCLRLIKPHLAFVLESTMISLYLSVLIVHHCLKFVVGVFAMLEILLSLS